MSDRFSSLYKWYEVREVIIEDDAFFLYRAAHKYGKFDNDWEKMNLLGVVFVPHRVSANAR